MSDLTKGGAYPVEDSKGNMLALLILPMEVRAFVGCLEALSKIDPDAVVRRAGLYEIRRLEDTDE